MPGDIIIWHMCTKNYDHMMYSSWDMVLDRQTDRQMDRQTDREKKWYIVLGMERTKQYNTQWKKKTNHKKENFRCCYCK